MKTQFTNDEGATLANAGTSEGASKAWESRERAPDMASGAKERHEPYKLQHNLGQSGDLQGGVAEAKSRQARFDSPEKNMEAADAHKSAMELHKQEATFHHNRGEEAEAKRHEDRAQYHKERMQEHTETAAKARAAAHPVSGQPGHFFRMMSDASAYTDNPGGHPGFGKPV